MAHRPPHQSGSVRFRLGYSAQVHTSPDSPKPQLREGWRHHRPIRAITTAYLRQLVARHSESVTITRALSTNLIHLDVKPSSWTIDPCELTRETFNCCRQA